MMGKMKSLLIGCLIMCGSAISAVADEVRPGVFRTPDERFEHLKDYRFAPHYLEVDSKIGKLRVHYVDVGPRDADPITKGGEKVFQKRVPGAQGQPHTIIKRASHFLQEDASEQLAKIINELIAETAGSN